MPMQDSSFILTMAILCAMLLLSNPVVSLHSRGNHVITDEQDWNVLVIHLTLTCSYKIPAESTLCSCAWIELSVNTDG